MEDNFIHYKGFEVSEIEQDCINNEYIFKIMFIAILNGRPIIGVSKSKIIDNACFDAFSKVFYNNGNIYPNNHKNKIYSKNKVISIDIKYKIDTIDEDMLVGNSTVIYQGEMLRSIAFGRNIEEMEKRALGQCARIKDYEVMAIEQACRYSIKTH